MKLDWNKMSGRERDALVAREIMGWKWWHFDARSKDHPMGPAEWCQLVSPVENWPKALKWGGKEVSARVEGVEDFTECPKFSTHIQSAWLVVERMRGKGWHFKIEGHTTEWVAIFINRFPYHTASAPTAPEAICLAACRAEGVEV